MALYLKGEAGKAMDATSRLAGDTLKCTGLRLRLETLASDKLTWTARTADLNATETILPEHEQIVELWQDSTRIFRGWATDPEIRNHGVAVTVEGPWYWLRKMQLSSSITGAANTDDRPTIIFAQQGLGAMVTALLTRAIALGAPIALGTIDAGWTVTKQQHTLATFADVLVALVAQMPDAVAWWSYAGTGAPTFNLTRRGSMSTVTHTVGAGGLEDYEVALYPSRVPSRVELKYITRTTTFGLPQMVTQGSGTAAAGRTQTIIVSGRELADFLPAEDYDSYEFQTVNAASSVGTLEASILNLLPPVVASRAQFPPFPRIQEVELANGENILWWRTKGPSTYLGYDAFPQPLFQCVDYDDPTTAVSRTGKHLVISAAPPDWAGSAIENLQRVRLRGRVWHIEEITKFGGVFDTGGGQDVENIPAWVAAFPWTVKLEDQGFYAPGHSGSTNPIQCAIVNFYAYDFDIEAWLTTTSQPARATLYKPPEYEYTVPPSGLAASLLAAQNFTPAEGRVMLKADSVVPDLTNVLARKFNIAGGRSELSAMGALARAVEHDLAAGTTRIELGSPARLDFGGRGGRLRGTPQTNITL